MAGSPYAIVASAATGGTFDAANYNSTYANGSLTVNQAALMVTVNSTSKTYGQTVSFTGSEFSSVGLQNSESIGSVSLVSTGAGATANVAGSPYAIVASGATGGTFDAANYTITYVAGSLTVNQALMVTANSTSKTYGQTVSFTGSEFSSIGLQNSESIGSVSLVSTGAGATANVAGSPYAIVASAATGGSFDAANYTITYVAGALTVNQAALMVTANDASKTYDGGAFFGGNGVAYSGFVNSETDAVLGGTVIYGGSSQGAINAGSYVISVSGLTSGNYDISYAPGALVILPGAPSPGPTVIAGAFEPGAAILTPENFLVSVPQANQTACDPGVVSAAPGQGRARGT